MTDDDQLAPCATFRHVATLDEVRGRAVITVEEVADVLGLGRSAAYEAARRGQIPSRRLGRRIVIPVPALMNWLERVTPDVHDDHMDASGFELL